MNERQRAALTDPLGSPDDPIEKYRSIRRHKAGFLVVTILAVDR